MCFMNTNVAAIDLPSSAKLVASDQSDTKNISLALSSWDRERGISRLNITGKTVTNVYQIDGTSLTLDQMFKPIIDDLENRKFSVELYCNTQVCGGFNFRKNLEIFKPPFMLVNVANYSVVTAKKNNTAVSLIASKLGTTIYLQVVSIGINENDLIQKIDFNKISSVLFNCSQPEFMAKAVRVAKDVIPKNIKIKSEKIRKEIEKILDDQKVGERIREGFKIAIIGPANAGKSSLLNHLSNRDVAIVSEIAGTTRDVIEAHLNLDGYPVVISDTAGIRESHDEIEKKGIKLALKRAEDADLNIIVIEPKSVDFTGFLNDLVSEKSIIVINKIDLGYKDINQQIEKFNPIFLSIKNETNLDELINRIKDKLKNKFVSSNETLITRERHRQSLEACVQNLQNFEKKNSQEDFDKAAEDLRLATRHLGMIVGKVDVEEILGSIFNDFCIGK